MISAGRNSKERQSRKVGGGAAAASSMRNTPLGVGTWRDKPNDMSEETKNYLSQVEKRDMEMEDIELTRVGEQVNELKDIVVDMNERVKKDKATLDPLGEEMAGYKGDVHEINARLKIAAKKGKGWGHLGRNVLAMFILVGQIILLAFTVQYILDHN